MRIAVVADIHGNVRALRAVMDDLKQVAPDNVVNLGDCASGPLEAAETIDVLMSLAWTTIRGNHDRQLLDRPAEKMGKSDRAAAGELKNHHSAWLASLESSATVEDILSSMGYEREVDSWKGKWEEQQLTKLCIESVEDSDARGG